MSGAVWLSLPAWVAVWTALTVLAVGQDAGKASLDRKYQAAVAAYEHGHAAEAVTTLNQFPPEAARSYGVQELLGMAYAALGQEAKAAEHLRAAAEIKPDLAEARTNLAVCLLHAGKAEEAGEEFRKAQSLDQAGYDTNHNLGEFYIAQGKVAQAQPMLRKAYAAKPEAYDNGYDLALADFTLGKLADARALVSELLKRKDTGELRNLLGQIDEKDGKFIEAANDFEAAAHLDPTEENIFDWACEMLLHRTLDPAITIFQQGSERFPQSTRMRIGLGLALYSRGKYDEAVKALIAATDQSPRDPRCYLFLSKAYHSAPSQAEDVIQRFRAYAEAEPTNAHAQYYYAISLWKGKRVEDEGEALTRVETLLQKAISLDAKLTDAYVQLGSLYADQHKYEPSVAAFKQALALNTNLPDAHYRLGTDYVHLGQKERAQEEFAVYQKQRADHLAQEDREKADVRQFVYAEKGVDSSRAN